MSDVLSVENLAYRYPGNQEDTLKGFTFSVRQGEIFGFLGPSGAGKSTTQKILIKLIRGYRGEYRIFGKDAVEWKRTLFNRIGVAFEEPNLYEKFTARENLSYFGSFYQGTIKNIPRLMEKVGLGGDIDRRVSAYSKGMKTRLNLVRAILHNPDFLFLDEPTSGLDPGYTRLVIDLIYELREEGKTVFLTTHNMEVADSLCDRLAFMVEGNISRIDSPERLKQEYGSRKISLEYLKSSRKIVVEFPMDGLGENAEFLELLKKLSNGDLQRLHSEEAGLADVFMSITGRRLS